MFKAVKIDMHFGRKSYRKSRWRKSAMREVKRLIKAYPDTKSITVII